MNLAERIEIDDEISKFFGNKKLISVLDSMINRAENKQPLEEIYDDHRGAIEVILPKKFKFVRMQARPLGFVFEYRCEMFEMFATKTRFGWRRKV